MQQPLLLGGEEEAGPQGRGEEVGAAGVGDRDAGADGLQQLGAQAGAAECRPVVGGVGRDGWLGRRRLLERQLPGRWAWVVGVGCGGRRRRWGKGLLQRRRRRL